VNYTYSIATMFPGTGKAAGRDGVHPVGYRKARILLGMKSVRTSERGEEKSRKGKGERSQGKTSTPDAVKRGGVL